MFVKACFSKRLTVRDQITSVNDNIPLAGVNVIVLGISQGVVTDFDGNLEISVNPDTRSQRRFIAYVTKIIAVEGRSQFTILL